MKFPSAASTLFSVRCTALLLLIAIQLQPAVAPPKPTLRPDLTWGGLKDFQPLTVARASTQDTVNYTNDEEQYHKRAEDYCKDQGIELKGGQADCTTCYMMVAELPVFIHGDANKQMFDFGNRILRHNIGWHSVLGGAQPRPQVQNKGGGSKHRLEVDILDVFIKDTDQYPTNREHYYARAKGISEKMGFSFDRNSKQATCSKCTGNVVTCTLASFEVSTDAAIRNIINLGNFGNCLLDHKQRYH